MKRSIRGIARAAVMLSLFGCETSAPLMDQTGTIKGIVVDSVTNLPLDSAIVGWKVHS